MKYEHIKEFCDKFNNIVNNFNGETSSKEDREFIDTWKLEIAKAMILDFNEDTMFEIACAVIDLYGE